MAKKEVKRFNPIAQKKVVLKEEVEKLKRKNTKLCTRLQKAKIMLINERAAAEDFAEMLWTKSIDGNVPLKSFCKSLTQWELDTFLS